MARNLERRAEHSKTHKRQHIHRTPATRVFYVCCGFVFARPPCCSRLSPVTRSLTLQLCLPLYDALLFSVSLSLSLLLTPYISLPISLSLCSLSNVVDKYVGKKKNVDEHISLLPEKIEAS